MRRQIVTKCNTFFQNFSWSFPTKTLPGTEITGGVPEFNIGKQEPESISILDSEIYTVCGTKDPIIYHFEPKIKE